MQSFELTHLSDATLDRELIAGFEHESQSTATLLARIAEFDARKRFVPYGYHSMHVYCVEALHRSEDAVYRRITAARTARQFPTLFPALSDGRLHLTAILLLAPHLTPENFDELIAAASHKSRLEIERWLVQRFPDAPVRKDVPRQLAPARVACVASDVKLAPARVEDDKALFRELAPARVGAQEAESEYFELRVRIPKSTHDDIRDAQALLSHAIPSGDLAQVLGRVTKLGVAQLKKQRLAATSKPRAGQRASTNPRHVPAAVRRAVLERDGGQCTFVGETGHRCSSRTRLEFDHIVPVARGGEATVANVRLRCRVHNQYEAERVFGAGFMIEKRNAARRSKSERAAAKRPTSRVAIAAGVTPPAPSEHARDIIAGLRGLGFRSDEARRAAEFAETLHDATLEERMRGALGFLRRPQFRSSAAHASNGAGSAIGT